MHLKYVKHMQNKSGKQAKDLPFAAFRNAKGRKRYDKRPPFGTQKTAFYNGVDYQVLARARTGTNMKSP